jgi:Cu-Zn family superoxide dismutase
MRRAALVTAIFFGSSAILIAAACADRNKDDEKPKNGIDAMPPIGADLPETGGSQHRLNYDGGLFIDPGGSDGLRVTQAIATLKSINGSRIEGTIKFTETDDGVRAGLDLTGLTYMGKYTLRIHLVGNCSDDDGTAAGPGFSFDDSSLNSHEPNAGMLGQISGDIDGKAKGEAAIDGPAIRGPFSIIGRSVVMHAAVDGLPSNDPQGQRIGCGVIGIYADVAAPVTTGDP